MRLPPVPPATPSTVVGAGGWRALLLAGLLALLLLAGTALSCGLGLAGYIAAGGGPVSLTVASFEVGLLPAQGAGAQQMLPGIHLGARPGQLGCAASGGQPASLGAEQVYIWTWHCPP